MTLFESMVGIYSNMIRYNFQLGAVITLMCLVKPRKCGYIIDSTGLHPNTVGNLLRSLCDQNLVVRKGRKPYTYELTQDGEIILRKLLTIK